ncbi:MAG: hypothetical protein L0922_05535, partial [Candidatus Mariimomonas ferrooxydans]
MEVFSEHGNAESDRAPFRYIRHSMGGRYTKNTIQYLLEQGHQVGLVASTDDHLGYPGAYGEGLVAVHADTLTRRLHTTSTITHPRAPHYLNHHSHPTHST